MWSTSSKIVAILYCGVLFLTFTEAVIDVKRSDDVSLTSLQAVVQQQAALIQSLQSQMEAEKTRAAAAETSLRNELTATRNALQSRVSALEGDVTALSKTVAFTVRFKNDNAISGIPIANHSPLRFDAIVLNTGNGYDPQTGIFTAPAAGTYSFFLTQMGVNDHGSLYLTIVKEGATIDLVYSKDHEDQGSSQVTAHLAVGQRVWVKHNSGDAVRGAWFTVFTGYLLHADV